MKWYLFIAVIFGSIVFQKCQRSLHAGLPTCLRDRIESLKQKPKRNPPAVVTEYTYRGKKVFFFNAECCDNFDEVVDENCNLVCKPSGGLTGRGDGACTDFASKAVLVREVWRDER